MRTDTLTATIEEIRRKVMKARRAGLPAKPYCLQVLALYKQIHNQPSFMYVTSYEEIELLLKVLEQTHLRNSFNNPRSGVSND